jgi:hypothetical protein
MAYAGLAGMLLDISGLIAEWGVRSTVTRLSGSLNASKRFSGAFVAKASGSVWIQPEDGNYRRGDAGALEETTHLAYVRKALNVLSGDRLLPVGDSYEYDVLSIDENPTHNVVLLRRVKR